MARTRLHRHGRRFGRRARGAVRARRDAFVLPQRGDLFGWSAWDASAVDAPARTNNSAHLGMGYVATGTGTINCSISFAFLLDAGTYRFDVIHRTFTNRGIYTVTDSQAGALGTFDGYSAGDVPNAVSSITGVSLAAGRHVLTFTMATKNASSSAYYYTIHSVTATRTGV